MIDKINSVKRNRESWFRSADKVRKLVTRDIATTQKSRADEKQAEVTLGNRILDSLVPLLAHQNISVLPTLELVILTCAELPFELSDEPTSELTVFVGVGNKVSNALFHLIE